MSDLQPLPNDPGARSPTGQILDATTHQPPTPEPTTTPTTTSDTQTNEPTGQTSPADPAAKPAEPSAADAVPERYEFRTPEGKELTSPLLDSVTPVFKELGLTQPQANKLVEAFNKHSQTVIDDSVQAIAQLGARWESETRADPEMGPKLPQIQAEIGRALETTLSEPELKAFRTAMNETMAGNNPAFVRAYWKLAQRIGPSTPVTGNPSPAGQNPNGTPNARPSVAASMWPKLPSATRS